MDEFEINDLVGANRKIQDVISMFGLTSSERAKFLKKVNSNFKSKNMSLDFLDDCKTFVNFSPMF